MMPELTIIVPLYNQEQYIQECLESILNQSFRNIEVIVVDDGSTDDSVAICEKIADQDNRVSTIRQENKGLAGARYTGLLHTKTKYVTFVDSDDFILNNSYENAVEAMKDNVDMIFFEITRFFDQTKSKREYHILESGYYNREKMEKEVFPRLIWDFKRNTPGIECSQCVRITKTELLLREYENLDEKKLYYGEDSAITYPLTLKIDNMQVISESFYMHRQRLAGVPSYITSAGFFDEVMGLYKHLLKAMGEELDKYDFRRQIEYLYIYSVNLKKMTYNDYEYHRDFIFPFNRVPCKSNIVLYGAGEVGKTYYKQLMKLQYCKQILWVDTNAAHMNLNDVFEPDKIEGYPYDYIVIAIENKMICDQIRSQLVSKGIEKERVIY